MINHRSRGLSTGTVLIQATGAFILFYLWKFLFFGIAETDPASEKTYFVCALIMSAGCFVEMIRGDFAHRSFLSLGAVGSQRLSIRQIVTALCLLMFYQFASKNFALSRLFLVSYLLLLYGQTFLIYRFVPAKLARLLFGSRRIQNTILVGPSSAFTKIGNWIVGRHAFGMKLVGVVSADSTKSDFADAPHLGNVEDLDGILETIRVENVVVTGENSPQELLKLADICESRGARLLLHNDICERLNRPMEFLVDDGHHFMTLRREPLECPWNRILKRTLDVFVSLPIVMFILPPLCLVVWFLQRRQSPGPLFIHQERRGLIGDRFGMYKFRTMHPNHGQVAKQATADDPRVYAAGKVLRKFSLDELPQFINVLLGEMSVVGPRPHLDAHDIEFAKQAVAYNVRRFLKPGITGLAQVRGFRGETKTTEDVQRRIESDLYYLENWSIGLDGMLILRTIFQFIRPPKTAY